MIEFKNFALEPLSKDHFTKIQSLEENEGSEYESSDKNEYEEDLEKRIYNYFGLEEEEPYQSSVAAHPSPVTTRTKFSTPLMSVSTTTPVNIRINNNYNSCSSCSPFMFYKNESENTSSSDVDWYKMNWGKKVKDYQKIKTPAAQYLYDLAINVYLREENNKVDPCEKITVAILKEENSKDISEIFDYYYGEEIQKKDIYDLGDLKETSHLQLQKFLEQNSALFAWKGEKLGHTNLVKHYISTKNALPIKHNLPFFVLQSIHSLIVLT
ncbi:hypothetical protein F8M41_000657 [Gigaspora margarita]|uniref:Uncharacterized protein n=1 Tax=Gigaspora margarita TaxID=4874 RepID=A0A8H4AZB7_GIGMA|nr:hypothetical protein F8M41_000657 [Gigaspora margarita]